MRLIRSSHTHRIVSLAAALALLLPAASAFAGAGELDEIRNAIRARGGRWHAEETSVSKLTLQEKKMRLGLNAAEGLENAALPTATTPIPEVTAGPVTLDWRNTDAVNYVSVIKNQGSCGSCWAFAVTAGLESQVMLATLGLPVDLAEQILVSCSGAGSCSGGSSATASTYARDVGVPPESAFRYTGVDTACTSAAAGWQTQTQKITGWHRPTITTTLVDAMKDALYAYGPVVASMYVYNDFYSYRGGVYNYTTGAYVGAHAVLVVGYDDVRQCFIVKNSWGTGWGEAGFFQIAYSEVGGTSNFAYSVLVYDGYNNGASDTAAPSVALSSPGAGATVSGTAAVSVAASDNVGVASVSLYVDGVLLATDAAAPFSFSWNTLAAANGAHSLKAVASDAAGNTGTSAAVAVTVANVADTTPPTVAVASPVNGATVSKTVKIKVNAADGSKLQRVEVYADAKLLGTAACSTSSCTATVNWNTSSATRGAHTITAYAYDAATNKGAAAVTVYR